MNPNQIFRFIIWTALFLIHKPITASAEETLRVPLHSLEKLLLHTKVPAETQAKISMTKEDKRLGKCIQPMAVVHRAQKLWGKSFIKVECVNADRPPFFIPIQIDVMGKVAVTTKPISIGSGILETDIEWLERNLTQLPTGWVMSKDEIQGKTTRVSLMAGQVISPSQLKGQPIIQRGQSVLIYFSGQSFEIKAHAVAMQAAEVGDMIRVKTQSGKILSVLVTAPGEVRLQSSTNG